MKLFLFMVVFSLVNLTTESDIHNQNRPSRKTPQNPIADHLLAKVQGDYWTDDETRCFKDITRLFEAARNHTLWATWVMDSMQVPVGALYGSRYHLGNFDQCLDETWSSSHPELETQYCLVDVMAQEQPSRKFDPYEDVERFFKSKSIYGRRRFFNSIGVCLPVSCSPKSVEKISIHIIKASHLPYGDVRVDARNCQVLSKTTAYSIGFKVFWLIIITLITVLATVYVVEDYITDPKLSEIAAWFSPSKNLKTIMGSRGNDVKSLHGIRSISCGALVVIHYIYTAFTHAVVNHASAGKDADTLLGRALSHLEILIQSFTMLSGFLFARGHCDSETLKPFDVIFIRYKRFIAPYVLVIFYVVSVSPYTGSGPLWPKYLKLEHEPCVRNWWSGLLMMYDTDNLCYVISWYMSCDFQLNILGLIILLFWRRDRKKGVMVFSAALVATVVIPAFLTYWHRLSPYLLYDHDISLDVTQNEVYHKVYSKTYSNGSSYLIGFALGFLFSIYKPEQNKKIISKTTSIIGSLALGYIVVSMMNAFGNLLFKEYDSFIFAWYAGIDKPVWALCLCGLVVICEYGTLPVVTDLLGSQLFVVSSRLSYGVYLVHMTLVNRNIFSLRAPVTYDVIHLIVDGLGYMTASFFLSFLQWFIIEAPATNILNYFQSNRSRNTRNIEVGKQNN